MTDNELRALDGELESGAMSEDEYLDTLRNEVSRLHPNYEQLDIDNMFKMQLRILALEDELAEDTCSEAISTIGGEFARAHAGPDGNDKAAQLQDAEQESADASPSAGQMMSDEKPGENQQSAQPKEPNGSTPNLDDGQQEPDKQDNGDQQDRQNDQDQKQNDKQDKSKDKNKDKNKAKSSKWWWTWQIVPDWNDWMKDDENADLPPTESTDIQESAASVADEFDKEGAITLTQQEDGTFSIPESEITHE